MKRTALKVIAGLGLLAMIPTVAMAHTDLSVGVNLGGGYYQPEPSYAAPAYYGQPAPYYGRTVEVRRDYRDHRDWDRREWEHRRWEHRHWDGYDRHHDGGRDNDRRW